MPTYYAAVSFLARLPRYETAYTAELKQSIKHASNISTSMRVDNTLNARICDIRDQIARYLRNSVQIYSFSIFLKQNIKFLIIHKSISQKF